MEVFICKVLFSLFDISIMRNVLLGIQNLAVIKQCTYLVGSLIYNYKKSCNNMPIYG